MKIHNKCTYIYFKLHYSWFPGKKCRLNYLISTNNYRPASGLFVNMCSDYYRESRIKYI